MLVMPNKLNLVIVFIMQGFGSILKKISKIFIRIYVKNNKDKQINRIFDIR